LPTEQVAALQAEAGGAVGVGDVGRYQTIAQVLEAQFEGDGETVVEDF
jgi:hypothetical protein